MNGLLCTFCKKIINGRSRRNGVEGGGAQSSPPKTNMGLEKTGGGWGVGKRGAQLFRYHVVLA